MSIRNAVLGLAVVFGVSVWAWSRPNVAQAQGQGTEGVAAATNGTHDEAAARFRCNQSTHWRQVAIGR